MHLHDPRESTLPAAGLLTIEDAETGELLEVDSSRAAVREKFAHTNMERLAELDRAFRRAGVDTLRFSTAEPFAQTLQTFFETRRGRRRGDGAKSEIRNPKTERPRPKQVRDTVGLNHCGAHRPRGILIRISVSLLRRPVASRPRLLPSPPPPQFRPTTSLPFVRLMPNWRPPSGSNYGAWVVILGLLLLALVCGVVWLLTRPKPPVVVPPEVQARQALEPLRHQPEDGALLSRVSQILRHYVAAAFDLPTGELTTMEFCRAIDGHAQIGPDLSAALSTFLRLCDQAKFSPPASVPPLSAVAQALKLIDQAQRRRCALAQPPKEGTTK